MATSAPVDLQNRPLGSYLSGQWSTASAPLREVRSAVSGKLVAQVADQTPETKAAVQHGRDTGGPALRAMTFHERALILKQLAQYLNERRDELYPLSRETGATDKDALVDIDGGVATLFVFSSKGRRELPNSTVYLDGAPEILARDGSFLGQHIYTTRPGVAVHINAFNFPVWGMLEKFAPAFIAGVPSIVKPATDTSYLTHRCVELMLESGLLPEGSLQLICGGVGDLFDHLDCQDLVSFTGSAYTAKTIRSHQGLMDNAVRVIAETDSLNASVLGPDATADSPEFELFVREVAKEMTTKAGQKCTAIRRALVPASLQQAVIEALQVRLGKVIVGNPADPTVRMGALSSQRQRRDVLAAIDTLCASECARVFGDQDSLNVVGADIESGAFVSPVLLHCADPDGATQVHEVEPFGPVSTVMPYRDAAHAIALMNRGSGSLVASVFTHDPAVAIEFASNAGAFHGRLLFADRDSAKTSTGHGSPLPHLVHGGPGRAGGGEEMGGIRGVLHYMQRTALQGSPRLLSAIGGRWLNGAPVEAEAPHPFRLNFNELELGKTIYTAERIITLEDIEHFANFTGDTFYAHMDEEAAAANPFFPGRVAHGYLLLSFAAGLFVDPAPGPVLANYGLDNLRFLKPVPPGDRIKVRLTAMEKNLRSEEYGEVRWNVEITNQDDEPVAQYELLTMNATA